MNRADTEGMLHRFFEARAANSYDALFALFAEDVVWRPPATWPIPVTRGREQVARALTGGSSQVLGVDAGSLDRRLGAFIVDSGSAAVLQTVTAVTPDGRVYTNDYLWTYFFTDGLFSELNEYTDTLAMARFRSAM